jgi:hypothetical protein
MGPNVRSAAAAIRPLGAEVAACDRNAILGILELEPLRNSSVSPAFWRLEACLPALPDERPQS